GIAVAPRRPAAVPVAAGAVRVLQADERELSVVGDVRVFVKRTARAAELRQRGDGEQQRDAARRQHARAHDDPTVVAAATSSASTARSRTWPRNWRLSSGFRRP